jgi:hypothetical protein
MCTAMLFLIAVHILSVYIFAAHQFTVSYDYAVSEKAQNIVEDYIRVSRLYEEKSFDVIVQQLQKQFPFLRKVVCTHAPSGLHMHLKAYDPFLQLTTGELITSNNCRVPADYYVLSASKKLPVLHASLAKNESLPEEMFAYMRSMDSSLIKDAFVHWRHNNEIVCDMQSRFMQLICNCQKIPTRELIERCTTIAHDLKDHPMLAKGFSADVRFADRIIVAKLRNEGVKG